MLGVSMHEAVVAVCSMLKFPGMRPTAEVVAILNKTPRRAQVVGILNAEGSADVLRLTPCDPRMPHMMVNASSIPAGIQQGLLVCPSLFSSCVLQSAMHSALQCS